MITNLKPYPAYKDSGVPWLGQVPEHWEVRRIKNAARVIMGQSPSSNDCSVERIGLPFLQGCAEFGVEYPQPKQFCKAPSKVSPAGAILMSVRAPVGRLNMADQEYGIGRGLCAIVPQPDLHNPRFIRFGVIVCMDGLAVLSTGSTYDAVSVTDVASLRIPLPPLPEQTAIVRFLDWADRRIRRVIRLREQRINLLEEYKQALINQAVTGKIDVRTCLRQSTGRQAGKPYPKYKPSGIEWLGQVPAHWEVRRLKSIARIRYGLGQPPREMNSGVPMLRATNVSHGIILENDLMYVDPHDVPRNRGAFLKAGEIIVVRSGAYTADSAIVPPRFEGAVAGYDMVVTAHLIEPEYLAFVLLTPYVRDDQLIIASMRSAQPHLNAEELGVALIVTPPIEEQKIIVEYLDTQTAKIDAAISATRRAIDLLKEFRTRLIADVVTGKVDVRGAAARLPDEPPGEEATSLDEEETAEDDKLAGEAEREAVSEEAEV